MAAHSDGLFYVSDFGAKSDGAADDTAAIQAAIEAAAPVVGTVIVPAGITMFSTLRLYANIRLRGSGMNQTILRRIGGSTTTAIREKTSAEGNPSGGTGLWVQDLQVDGNSTTGDGLDLGNQVNGVQLNFNAGVENVHVRNFTSGTGIRIRGNAVQCKYLWSNLNSVGIETQGGGNAWYGLLAEGNTSRDLLLGTSGDSYYHLQVETNPATIPVEITGNQNSMFGLYVALGGNVVTVIRLTTGATRNSLYEVYVDNANGVRTFTQVILVQSQSQGTGSTQYRFPAFLQTDGFPMWVYDQSSNIRIKISGTGIDSDPGGFASLGAGGTFALVKATRQVGGVNALTYGTTVSVDAAAGNIQTLLVTNGTAFTMANPTNSLQGQRLTIRVGNGSGGAMGTITWSNHYFLAGTFTNPGNSKSRVITFYCEDGTNWAEESRGGADQ